MRMTTRLLTVVAAVATLSLVACGSDSGDSTDSGGEGGELQLLRPGDPAVVRDIFEPLLETFQQDSDSTVEIVDMGWGEYFQRLPQLVAAGDNPDVQQVQQTLLYNLIEQGAYLPITERIDDELRAQIPAALWEAATVDGEIYYVPAAVGSFVLWYNADLFEQAGLDPDQPPATWDDLLADATAVTAATGKPGLGFPGQDGGDLVDLFAAIHASRTGLPLYEDDAFTFVDNGGQETLELLLGAMEDGVVQPNATQFTRADVQAMFRDGEVAMVIDGPWIISTLAAAHDLAAPDSPFRTAPLPQDQDAGTYTTSGIEGWSISADADDPDAAWELLRYLVEPDNQLAHTLGYGLVPVQKDNQSGPAFEAPYWDALIQAQEESFSRIKSQHAEALNLIVQEMVATVLAGAASPADAVATVEEQLSAAG